MGVGVKVTYQERVSVGSGVIVKGYVARPERQF